MSTKTLIMGNAGAIQTEEYTRKPFRVEAVEVTEANQPAVALWCDSEIRHAQKSVRDEKGELLERVKVPYIKVHVQNPVNERQTKAYVGDFVLRSDSGFKVYTSRAFEKSFESAAVHITTETVEELKHRAETPKFRDAGTGKYVSEEYAKLNPETTVSEHDYVGGTA